MIRIKKTPTLDPNLLKNHLYNTSILLPVTITLTERTTNPQDLLIDIVVEVHHVIVIQTIMLHPKIDIVLTAETDTSVTELLLLHNLTDQDLTTTDEIHVLIVHHTDLRIDRHIEKIHVIDINHVHTLEIDNFHNTLRHIDLLHNHENLDLSDIDQVLRQKNKVNNIQTEQLNSPINFGIHMYHPTEMANALTPTSWLYYLYLHTPERYNENHHPSRLEISYLLDSGASIAVLNYPTYLTIAKLLNIT